MSSTGHRRFADRWFSSPPPTAAVAIEAGRVVGVALGHAGDGPAVVRHAAEPLPAGAVTPGLNQANVPDPDALAEAVGRVLDRIGRPRRIGLVLADTTAKVSLVRFESLPARSGDLDQLVRWHVRKAVPFPVESAQVSWTPGAHIDGAHELVVCVMRRDIVDEYEAACVRHKAQAGIVDIATFNLVNLALAADRRAGRAPTGGDWLLVSLTHDYSALAIVRDDALIFYRYRPAEADEPLADLVHQASMYYEDRLGGRGLSRVVISGGESANAGQLEALQGAVASRWQCALEPLDAARAAPVTDRITAAPDLLTAMAPAVGLVLREA